MLPDEPEEKLSRTILRSSWEVEKNAWSKKVETYLLWRASIIGRVRWSSFDMIKNLVKSTL